MISIRAVRESDLDILYEHQNDPVAQEMAVFGGRDRESYMPTGTGSRSTLRRSPEPCFSTTRWPET